MMPLYIIYIVRLEPSRAPDDSQLSDLHNASHSTWLAILLLTLVPR